MIFEISYVTSRYNFNILIGNTVTIKKTALPVFSIFNIFEKYSLTIPAGTPRSGDSYSGNKEEKFSKHRFDDA